jgi:hypothetical protein
VRGPRSGEGGASNKELSGERRFALRDDITILRGLVIKWRADDTLYATDCAYELEELLDAWIVAIVEMPDYVRFEQTIDFIRQRVLGEKK